MCSDLLTMCERTSHTTIFFSQTLSHTTKKVCLSLTISGGPGGIYSDEYVEETDTSSPYHQWDSLADSTVTLSLFYNFEVGGWFLVIDAEIYFTVTTATQPPAWTRWEDYITANEYDFTVTCHGLCVETI